MTWLGCWLNPDHSIRVVIKTMPLPIRPRCWLVTPFRQFCKLLIDQFISKSNTLLCLSCWYDYLKWCKVIFWLSGAVAIPHNTQLRSYGGVVKYEPSLYFRQLCDSCIYECACILSDLSYSLDLALTLMSARMRGARAGERSYLSCSGSEIKLTDT